MLPGIFGFLRAAEFTEPSDEAFDPSAHLSLADIAIDSHSNLSLLQVHIKQSKTDPFRKRVHIYISHSQSDICPVAKITEYPAARVTTRPSVSVHKWMPLTQPRLKAELRAALKNIGVNPCRDMLWPQF